MMIKVRTIAAAAAAGRNIPKLVQIGFALEFCNGILRFSIGLQRHLGGGGGGGGGAGREGGVF